MICKNCKREFELKRTGRKPTFCSAKCRVYYHRGTGSPIPVAEKESEMPVNEKVAMLKKILASPNQEVMAEPEEPVDDGEFTVVTEEEIPEEYIMKPGYGGTKKRNG